MATFIEVNSYENFVETIGNLEEKKVPIFAEFYGQHDSSGKSWCPDCVRAEPVVAEVMKTKAPAGSYFLHVSVGDRASWKNPSSPFRSDTKLKLTCIPTLIRWGTKSALYEEQCAVKSDVEKFVVSP